MIKHLGPFLALVPLLGACGAAIPPQELVDARSAFKRASAGPATELAPAQLDTAKQALDGAEKQFQSDGPNQKTKDAAYIAERRAEIAEAEASREAAERQRSKADKDFKTTQIEGLAKTKEQLEAERRAREATKAEAERTKADADRNIASSKDEVNRTKAELASEKAAREAAEKKAAAAMASLAEIAKVKEESRGVVITLSGSVLFATGKSDLLPIAKDKLNEVAKALKDQGFKSILIEGHTDSRGKAADNDKLSLKRAESVRDHLLTQGIPSDKVRAEGLGSSRPVAENDTAEGRANNRRVEIVVTPDK